jgi:hypothetical protein
VTSSWEDLNCAIRRSTFASCADITWGAMWAGDVDVDVDDGADDDVGWAWGFC